MLFHLCGSSFKAIIGAATGDTDNNITVTCQGKVFLLIQMQTLCRNACSSHHQGHVLRRRRSLGVKLGVDISIKEIVVSVLFKVDGIKNRRAEKRI